MSFKPINMSGVNINVMGAGTLGAGVGLIQSQINGGLQQGLGGEYMLDPGVGIDILPEAIVPANTLFQQMDNTDVAAEFAEGIMDIDAAIGETVADAVAFQAQWNEASKITMVPSAMMELAGTLLANAEVIVPPIFAAIGSTFVSQLTSGSHESQLSAADNKNTTKRRTGGQNTAVGSESSLFLMLEHPQENSPFHKDWSVPGKKGAKLAEARKKAMVKFIGKQNFANLVFADTKMVFTEVYGGGEIKDYIDEIYTVSGQIKMDEYNMGKDNLALYQDQMKQLIMKNKGKHGSQWVEDDMGEYLYLKWQIHHVISPKKTASRSVGRFGSSRPSDKADSSAIKVTSVRRVKGGGRGRSVARRNATIKEREKRLGIGKNNGDITSGEVDRFLAGVHHEISTKRVTTSKKGTYRTVIPSRDTHQKIDRLRGKRNGLQSEIDSLNSKIDELIKNNEAYGDNPYEWMPVDRRSYFRLTGEIAAKQEELGRLETKLRDMGDINIR